MSPPESPEKFHDCLASPPSSPLPKPAESAAESAAEHFVFHCDKSNFGTVKGQTVMAAGEGHRKRMRIMIGRDTMLWLYNIDDRFFYGPFSPRDGKVGSKFAELGKFAAQVRFALISGDAPRTYFNANRARVRFGPMTDDELSFLRGQMDEKKTKRTCSPPVMPKSAKKPKKPKSEVAVPVGSLRRALEGISANLEIVKGTVDDVVDRLAAYEASESA